jgi:hypothetical protein
VTGVIALGAIVFAALLVVGLVLLALFWASEGSLET